MNLKNFTLLAFVGYTYFFIMRLIGTIFPTTNYNFTWMISEVFLNLIAGLVIAIFFLYFLKEFVRDDEISLLNSTAVAFLGSLAILLVNALNGISSILAMPMDYTTSGRYIINMLTWIQGFILVIFFLMLTDALHKRDCPKLCSPVLWGLAGSITSFLLHSFNLLNYYFYSSKGTIFLDLDRNYLIIPGVILILFSYNSLIYFMLNFYKHITNRL